MRILPPSGGFLGGFNEMTWVKYWVGQNSFGFLRTFVWKNSNELLGQPDTLPELRGDSVVKNPLASTGDTRNTGSIPVLGRSPGRGNGNLLQYSCLENPMDRGDWQSTVYRIAELDMTKRLSMHT